MPETMGSAVLVPGLKISVEPESAGQNIVAKTIKFSVNDRETADAIRAALGVPQQQIQALTQELAAQKQQNAQQNAAQDQQIAATGKRIPVQIADYPRAMPAFKSGNAVLPIPQRTVELRMLTVCKAAIADGG